MALCFSANNLDRNERNNGFMAPRSEPLNPLQEFARKQIRNISMGDYGAFEYNAENFMEDGRYEWDDMYQALLEAAIKENYINTVRYIVRRMGEVQILKSIDFEKSGKCVMTVSKNPFGHSWGNLHTPFVCKDPEIMEEMLSGIYQDTPQYVVWEDGKKLSMKKLTISEAALASANIELYDLIGEVTGDWSWPGQEVLFLSDDPELISRYIGRFTSLDTESEAFYWMSEEATQMVTDYMGTPASEYDLEKILKAANPVLLAKYLMAYEDIEGEVISSWEMALQNASWKKMTVEMCRDQCGNNGCYCMPYSIPWMRERKASCLQILEDYHLGIRDFFGAEPDDNGWDGWDEYEDDNTYERLPD